MQMRRPEANPSKLDIINNHLNSLLGDMKTLEDQCQTLKVNDSPRTLMIVRSEIECQRSLISFLLHISQLIRSQAQIDDSDSGELEWRGDWLDQRSGESEEGGCG
jgi:hypothetical protein